METLNKNWFTITLTAVVFGLIGFILGRQCNQQQCPMMNGPHKMMFMEGGPHKMMGGESKFMFKTDDGKEIEWIEDVDIQKEEGENGEKKIKIQVKAKGEQIVFYFKPQANPLYTLNMKTTAKHNERIAGMTFASVYPHYVNKIEKKGRKIDELHQVIEWLTGYDVLKIKDAINNKDSFKIFFENANLNPKANLITGKICGYRIEEIDNTLTRQVRCLDKLIDELAKGRKMEKILRN